MNFTLRSLPAGSLPYENIKSCKNMMLRLYEQIPFLAELPFLDPEDNVIRRTLENIPAIKYKDKKIMLPEVNSMEFLKASAELDKAFSSTDINDITAYSSTSPFYSLYKEMLARIKPQNTVIRLLGPFTFADMVFNQNTALLLSDKNYRKYIVQMMTVKAAWFINEIRTASPDTKILVVFEEPHLYRFGSLKRQNSEINKDNITSLYTKLFSKIKKSGAYICVESFEKCNWQLVLEAGVDMISFDAYNNPNSLNIIAPRINDFLAQGGYINWAIIPATNEKAIRNSNAENILSKFKKATETLAINGASLDAIYRNATISIQGNLSKLPILFAEKALILENQLVKRMPTSSRL